MPNRFAFNSQREHFANLIAGYSSNSRLNDRETNRSRVNRNAIKSWTSIQNGFLYSRIYPSSTTSRWLYSRWLLTFWKRFHEYCTTHVLYVCMRKVFLVHQRAATDTIHLDYMNSGAQHHVDISWSREITRSSSCTLT